MIPGADISHVTSGRLRVKIPSKKGDAAYFLSVKEGFSRLQGIERIDTNALTGSVLFIHSIDSKIIAEYAGSNNMFRISNPGPEALRYSKIVVNTFKAFDKKIKGFTGNELDTPGLAFLTLFGLGIYQISRGNFAAPAWYTAFWYALNVFLKAQPDSSSGEGE